MKKNPELLSSVYHLLFYILCDELINMLEDIAEENMMNAMKEILKKNKVNKQWLGF